MKGQAVSYSPEQWEDIANRAARLLVDEIKEAAGGIEALVVLPLATVAQCTGLSRQRVPDHLATTNVAPGKTGVQLSVLRAHLDKNTKPAKRAAQPLALVPG